MILVLDNLPVLFMIGVLCRRPCSSFKVFPTEALKDFPGCKAKNKTVKGEPLLVLLNLITRSDYQKDGVIFEASSKFLIMGTCVLEYFSRNSPSIIY